MPCGTVKAPLARGRPLVLSTLLSRSRSHKSLTVQPAPLRRIAPVPNKASSTGSGRLPEGAASAIDQKHGHTKSHVPVVQKPNMYDMLSTNQCVQWVE